jgi:hypothetical protein
MSGVGKRSESENEKSYGSEKHFDGETLEDERHFGSGSKKDSASRLVSDGEGIVRAVKDRWRLFALVDRPVRSALADSPARSAPLDSHTCFADSPARSVLADIPARSALAALVDILARSALADSPAHSALEEDNSRNSHTVAQTGRTGHTA